jgi:cold shock CspA family protein
MRQRGPLKAGEGFGFILPNVSGKDVFMHITAVQTAALTGAGDRRRAAYPRERSTQDSVSGVSS